MKKTFTAVAVLFSVMLNAQVFNITNFGAVGNGITIHRVAIQVPVGCGIIILKFIKD